MLTFLVKNPEVDDGEVAIEAESMSEALEIWREDVIKREGPFPEDDKLSPNSIELFCWGPTLRRRK